MRPASCDPYSVVARTLSPRDINALIHLLGDDDGWVRGQARDALRDAGSRAAPYLERASQADEERTVRRESRRLVEEIHAEAVEQEWVALQAAADEVALEEGAFLLERLVHPSRTGHQLEARGTLEALSQAARRAIPATAGRAQRVAALATFLHEAGFHGNTGEYYDPENSFLSSVLERRTGIPITLALVWIAIGRRVDVPLVGIGMPMHFLVGWRAGGSYRYLDPFYGGREVSHGECLLLLERAGFDDPRSTLRPAPVVAILERMARNLVLVYDNRARSRELGLARRFVSILTGEPA